MHKKAISIILSLTIVGASSSNLVSFANENLNTKQSKQEITQNTNQYNTVHSVHSTNELQSAIEASQEGDLIKVYPGEYTATSITITTPNVTIAGYNLDDTPVTNYSGAIDTKAAINIDATDTTIQGLETKGINVGHKNTASNSKILNSYIGGYLYLGYYNTSLDGENITVDRCNVSESLYSNNNKNIIKNTEATWISISGNDTNLSNCTMNYLEIGDDKKVTNNIKVSDSNILSAINLGFRNDMANNVVLERVDSKYAKIGMETGLADNITILDSDIDTCYIGKDNRGKSSNTSIYNTNIGALEIGTNTGVANNTKILNSNIKYKVNIGNNDGNALNTIIETKNTSIEDNGKNTFILNTLTSNINKLKGYASSGMRVEVYKDGAKLIDKTIEEDKILDEYFKVDDPSYVLVNNDNIDIKIYSTDNTLIFEENIIIKNPVASLPAPKMDEISNTSYYISGYAYPGSTVYVLLENQDENDTGIMKKVAGSDGYFSIKPSTLSGGEILRIYSKDNANNISETIEVEVLDKISPSVRIDDMTVEDDTIKGFSEPGCKVTAYLKVDNSSPGKYLGESVVNEHGRYYIPFDEVLWNQADITVYATDKSSNTGSDTVTVYDKTTPIFNSVDKITDKSTVIKGTVSEANANIVAKYVGEDYNQTIRDIGTTKSDKKGNFEISIPFEIDSKNKILLIASDTANNYTEHLVKIQETLRPTDLNNHWAKDYVYDFIDSGYINGYEDNTFKPDNQITRAEFVKIVNKVFGYTEAGEISFTDIASNAWYKNEVAIAVKAGYINGKSDTIFDPEAPITRQEAAKIIATIKNCADNDFDKLGSFSDNKSVDSWAKAYVEGVIEAGYMNGYSDNTFRPNQKITRAEAVVTLQRTIK